MTTRIEILELFIKQVVQRGDYSPAGVEMAFDIFCKTVSEHQHKPKERAPNMKQGDFVKTTLKEAAEAARAPIYIPACLNQYGNMESTVCPGLVFKEDGDGRWYAHGIQDGEKIAPLSMNYVLVCAGNGWRYDETNLSGSAVATSSELKIKPK